MSSSLIIPWGLLLPSNQQGEFRRMDLTKDETKFGRAPNCDYQISMQKDKLTVNEYFNVSKEHFSIIHSDNKAFLTDHSMNGSFINGIRVGNGHSSELTQGDIISINVEFFNMFKFVMLL